ncbi:MAG TPA: acetate--CoA ligase family protein, partial [Micromonosporaceae bacterium]
ALGAVAAGRARQARFVARISTETPATNTSEQAMPDEVAAKAMLAAHGVQIPRFALVEEADAAADAADGIGYPVVVKIVSAAIPHKAAVGALALDIHTADAARQAFARLAETRARLNTSTPASIIVEKQVKGVEAFVGSVAHADHGGIVAIGAGGGAIETDRRISWSWHPVDADAVAGSLRRYLGSGVTDGQIEAITRLADATNVSLHQIGARFFECNPVILTADGGAVVADALIDSAADTTTPGELFMRTARS